MKHLEKVFTRAGSTNFKKKDTVLSPTSNLDKVFFLKEGFLISYVLGKNYKRSILYTLKPGDVFPVVPGIIHTQNFAFIEALTEAKLLSMNRTEFFKIVNSDKKYLIELTRILSEYLFVYSARVSNLELSSLEKRVIGRLLHFSARFGVKKGKAIRIDIPLTHTIIAQSINAARENVSRELKKLENDSLIEFKGGYITILDEKALEKKLQE